MNVFKVLFGPFGWLWDHTFGSSEESKLKRTERESKRSAKGFRHQGKDTKTTRREEKHELKLEKGLYKEERKASKAVKRLKRALQYGLEVIAAMRYRNTPQVGEEWVKAISAIHLLSGQVVSMLTAVEEDIQEEETEDATVEEDAKRLVGDAKAEETVSAEEESNDPTITSVEDAEENAEQGVLKEAKELFKTEEWKKKMQEVELQVFAKHEVKVKEYDALVHRLQNPLHEGNFLQGYDHILDALMRDLLKARRSVAKEMSKTAFERKNLRRMGKLAKRMSRTEKKVGREVRDQEREQKAA